MGLKYVERYSEIQYSTVQYSTVQYSAIKYIELKNIAVTLPLTRCELLSSLPVPRTVFHQILTHIIKVKEN